MTTFARRLAWLEAFAPKGCAICRGWGSSVHVVDRLAADGTVDAGPEPRPEECPGCGRHVPIRLTRRIVLEVPAVDMSAP